VHSGTSIREAASLIPCVITETNQTPSVETWHLSLPQIRELSITLEGRPMRILLVNHLYEELGGAEVYFRSLSRWLEERGHEVRLFATSSQTSIDEEHIRVVRRPTFDAAHLIDDPELSQAFLLFAEKAASDVIHVHNVYSLPAAMVGLFGSLGIPTVQTVHDFSLVCTNGWCVLPDGRMCAGGPGKKCLDSGCEANMSYDVRLVLAASMRLEQAREAFDAFVSPSAYLAEKCQANGLRPVHRIPYHVDPNLLPTPVRARVAKRILFAGRLAPEKGLSTLIDAMARVQRELSGVELHLAGSGNEEATLRQRVVQLGLESHVTFLGHRSRAEVLELLQTSTLLVVPSHWCENSPVSCYESLLAGLPMVASNIGGIPELVRDGITGLLVEPRSSEDLASKLVRLLQEKELHGRLSENCKQAAHQYSDLASHLKLIEDVYEEVLDKGRPVKAGFERQDDLIAAVQQMNLRYTQMLEWSVYGGRPRRILRKAANTLFRGPKYPPLGAP